MAQRSYELHQAIMRPSDAAGNTIKDFIAALEQEEPTEGAEPS